MTSVSSHVVSVFNSFANGVSTVSSVIPERVKGGLTYLFANLAPGSQKNFWTKPVILIGEAVKYFNLRGSIRATEGFDKWMANAKIVKSFTSATEILSNLPYALRAISSPIIKGETLRRYVKLSSSITGSTTEALIRGPKLTKAETVARKMSSIALWLVSFGDAVNEFKNYRSPAAAPMLLSRVTPWIQIGSGTFMGVWGLYEEGRFAKATWLKERGSVHTAEICLSMINLATSTAYLAYSIVGGYGLSLSKPNKWIGHLQFWASAVTVVLPLVQNALKSHVNHLHESLG